MRFFAKTSNSLILTDDYSSDEIKKELHIKNIIKDVREQFPASELKKGICVDIRDEKNNIVKRFFLYC